MVPSAVILSLMSAEKGWAAPSADGVGLVPSPEPERGVLSARPCSRALWDGAWAFGLLRAQAFSSSGNSSQKKPSDCPEPGLTGLHPWHTPDRVTTAGQVHHQPRFICHCGKGRNSVHQTLPQSGSRFSCCGQLCGGIKSWPLCSQFR